MNSLNKIQKIVQISLVVMTLLMAPLSSFAAEVVDINRADAATMIENWKGIGEKKARAIVAYRKKNGAFASVNDLANVTGVGEGLIKKNKKYMSVSKGAVKPSGKSTASKSTTKKDTSKKATAKNSSKDKAGKATKPTKKKANSTAKKDSKTKKKTTKKSKKKDCTAKSTDKNCKKKPAKKKAKTS